MCWETSVITGQEFNISLLTIFGVSSFSCLCLVFWETCVLTRLHLPWLMDQGEGPCLHGAGWKGDSTKESVMPGHHCQTVKEQLCAHCLFLRSLVGAKDVTQKAAPGDNLPDKLHQLLHHQGYCKLF